MSRSIFVGIPLLVLLLVLQTSALPYLQVGGITPQLALLAAISWGLQRGAAEGMVWAFFAGMMLDAFSFAPQGTTAISLMVAILAVTRLQQVVPENPVLLPVLLTGLTFAVYLALSLVVLWLTGHSFPGVTSVRLCPPSSRTGCGLRILAGRTLDRMLFPRPIEACPAPATEGKVTARGWDLTVQKVIEVRRSSRLPSSIITASALVLCSFVSICCSRKGHELVAPAT